MRWHLKYGIMYYQSHWGVGSLWSPTKGKGFDSQELAETWLREAIDPGLQHQFEVVHE